MDIGTIQGALTLKNEASAVVKQFEADVTTSTNNAANQIIAATKQIQEQLGKVAQSFAEVNKAISSGGGAAESLGKIAPEAGKAVASMGSLETAFNRVLSSTVTMQTGMWGLGSALTSLGPAFLYGAVAAGTATAAIYEWGKVIGTSVQMAADFQTAMYKIGNLSSESVSHINQMSDALLKMAPAVGKGPLELANAMFFATSAGFQGAEALKMVELAAKASAIGLGDTATIVRAMNAALFVFKDTGLTATQAMNILVATVKEGHMPTEELAGALGRVLSVTKVSGASFADAAAFIATFTRAGVDANEAVTALRGVLTVIIHPAKQSADALREIGFPIEKLRQEVKEKGLTEAMIDLFQHLDKGGEAGKHAAEGLNINLDALGHIIPRVRALAGALATAGTEGDTYRHVLQEIKKASEDVNYTEQKFSETEKTFNQQMNELKATISASGIALGNDFLPMLTKLVNDAKPAAEWMMTLARAFGQVTQAFVNAQFIAPANAFGRAVSYLSDPGAATLGAANLPAQSTSTALSADMSAMTQINVATGAATADAAAKTRDYAKDLKEARVAVAALSQDQREQLNAALFESNKKFQELAETYKLNSMAQKVFQSDSKDTKKELSETAREAEKAADAFKNLKDKISGKDAIEDAKNLVNALKAIGGTRFIDPAQAESMRNDLQNGVDAARRLGAAAVASMGDGYTAATAYLGQLDKIARSYKDQQDYSKQAMASVKEDIKLVDQSVGQWAADQDKLNGLLVQARQALMAEELSNRSKEFQDYFKNVEKTNDDLEKLKDEFRGVQGPARNLYDELIHLKQTQLDDYFYKLMTQTPEFKGMLIGLSAVFPQLAGAAASGFPEVAKHLGNAKKATTDWSDALQSVAQAFTNLSQVSGNTGMVQSIAQMFNIAEIGLGAISKVREGIKQLGADGAKDMTAAFANIAVGLVQGVSGLIGASDSGKDTISRAISGAISGAELGSSIGSIVGAAAVIGGSTAKGAAIGGAWGAAAGAIVGVFIAVLSGRDTRREMEKVGAEWGVSISQGLAETINKEGGKLPGGADTAAILHMTDILKEAGGVSQGNFGTLLSKLHDVFSFLARDQITVAQAQDVLNKSFGDFASVLDKTGGIAPKAFQDIIRLNKEMGVNSQTIIDYVNTQTSTIGTNLAKLIDPLTKLKTATDDDQASFDRLGTITLAAFNASIRGGASMLQAMQSLGPAIDNLIAAQTKLGFSVDNAALSELIHFRQVAQANQDMLVGAQALNDTMVALSKIGGLDVDTFKALETQGVQTFNKMIAAGFTSREALASIAGFLSNILDAHKKMGLPIDEETQKLIDQAKEYGLLSEDAKTTADIMKEGFDKVVEAVDNLARGLGVNVPQAAQQATNAIRNIPTDIGVNVHYNPSNVSHDPDVPQFAVGGIATRATLGIFGERGPEALIPLDRAAEFGLGKPATQQINLYLDGRLITKTILQNMPRTIDLFGGMQ